MRVGMAVPTRVAAATSNLMIGVTAAASLIIYTERGFLVPAVAAPIALGVVGGALAGTKLSGRISGASLAKILSVLLVVVAIGIGPAGTGIGSMSGWNDRSAAPFRRSSAAACCWAVR